MFSNCILRQLIRFRLGLVVLFAGIVPFCHINAAIKLEELTPGTSRKDFELPLFASGLSGGSGFFVDHHANILTAGHVIKACSKIFVVNDEIQPLVATVLDYNAALDLAILQVGLRHSPFIELESKGGSVVQYSSTPSDFRVVGYPGRIIGLNADERSAQQPVVATWLFQSDVRGGNSGGPIINSDGKVVGLVTQGVTGQGKKPYGIAVSGDVLAIYLDGFKADLHLGEDDQLEKQKSSVKSSIVRVFCIKGW